MNIFVSYTTRNNEVTITTLINFSNKINSFGNIFIDLIDNNSENKQGRIIEELKASDLLILVKSKSTYNSEWVNFELQTAKKLKIPIIEFDIAKIDDLSEVEIGVKINNPNK